MLFVRVVLVSLEWRIPYHCTTINNYSSGVFKKIFYMYFQIWVSDGNYFFNTFLSTQSKDWIMLFALIWLLCYKCPWKLKWQICIMMYKRGNFTPCNYLRCSLSVFSNNEMEVAVLSHSKWRVQIYFIGELVIVVCVYPCNMEVILTTLFN